MVMKDRFVSILCSYRPETHVDSLCWKFSRAIISSSNWLEYQFLVFMGFMVLGQQIVCNHLKTY